MREVGMTKYRLGEFVFQIQNPGVPIPENFQKFQVTEGEAAYTYTFEIAEELNWGGQAFQVQKEQIRIAVADGLETRCLCIPGEELPYAVSRELDDHHTLVQVRRSDMHWFAFDNVFGSLLSPERRMAEHGAYILHSAYLVYRNEAILFTAPSGVGKSTQAELWRKYRGAEVINGDRSLLRFRDGRLTACGWPVCGSSGICQNRDYPVRAIVLLEQAKENRADRLTEQEYTLRLMREITINYHNSAFFDGAMAFIGQVISGADLWRLQCDISEDAVRCLERALYGGAQ